MVKYNDLNVTAKPARKRVGRGISAGQGKTAGRGTKGQNARTGKKLRPTFAGGQLPLVQGIPKSRGRGFTSKRVPAQVVYADQLNDVKGATIDNFALYDAGLINTPYQAVKIIARGDLTSKAKVEVSGMSKSVQAALAKNGGAFTATPVPLKKSEKVKEEKPEKAGK
jgi:large subunit ribosomal protein L15